MKQNKVTKPDKK